MALLRICDEDRTLTDQAEIAGHLAACGIDYDVGNQAIRFRKMRLPEVILHAYAKEID